MCQSHVYLCVNLPTSTLHLFPKLLCIVLFLFRCECLLNKNNKCYSPCNCSAMQLPVAYHRVGFELPAYSLGVDDAAAVEFAFEYFVDHHFRRGCHRSDPIVHDILHFVRCMTNRQRERANWFINKQMLFTAPFKGFASANKWMNERILNTKQRVEHSPLPLHSENQKLMKTI